MGEIKVRECDHHVTGPIFVVEGKKNDKYVTTRVSSRRPGTRTRCSCRAQDGVRAAHPEVLSPTGVGAVLETRALSRRFGGLAP